MKEKIDKESLEIMKDLAKGYKVAKEWLLQKGYITTEKMAVPTMMEAAIKTRAKCKEEEGLAFEIFEVANQKKVNVRKIYIDGRTEGFEESPFCIINHMLPKIMAHKALLKQMNKDYRDFIERHLLADLPIGSVTLSKLYQAQLERINSIKI